MGKNETREDNTYTRIVVAAQEARRMNALRLRGGMIDSDAKITSEALRRAFSGEVAWEFLGGTGEEPTEAVAAEAPPEETEAEDPSVGD